MKMFKNETREENQLPVQSPDLSTRMFFLFCELWIIWNDVGISFVFQTCMRVEF